MSATATERHILEGLIDMVHEEQRLESLSNKELVIECLNSNLENERIIEHMMTRLYPDWISEETESKVQ